MGDSFRRGAATRGEVRFDVCVCGWQDRARCHGIHIESGFKKCRALVSVGEQVVLRLKVRGKCRGVVQALGIEDVDDVPPSHFARGHEDGEFLWGGEVEGLEDFWFALKKCRVVDDRVEGLVLVELGGGEVGAGRAHGFGQVGNDVGTGVWAVGGRNDAPAQGPQVVGDRQPQSRGATGNQCTTRRFV